MLLAVKSRSKTIEEIRVNIRAMDTLVFGDIPRQPT